MKTTKKILDFEKARGVRPAVWERLVKELYIICLDLFMTGCEQ